LLRFVAIAFCNASNLKTHETRISIARSKLTVRMIARRGGFLHSARPIRATPNKR